MVTQTRNTESQHQTKIPATMQAVVYRGINDMRVETVPVTAIGRGELLVRVATCGICGTDLKKIHYGSHSAPRIFGHEMSGTIVAAGEAVEAGPVLQEEVGAAHALTVVELFGPEPRKSTRRLMRQPRVRSCAGGRRPGRRRS